MRGTRYTLDRLRLIAAQEPDLTFATLQRQMNKAEPMSRVIDHDHQKPQDSNERGQLGIDPVENVHSSVENPRKNTNQQNA